ncbi:hypothetical protein [Rhizobium sp. L1K21]|uniref:hypothetical protein n=1 Tax=Rhizobium sp. L1K21 TaxID=2954933 RepID=UPI002092B704|nr:hypothetical protein [Rhizobium sp. L1K21]MCO6186575.1 hypothetical protein [Rhizobium sp. L1K21]
MHTALELPKRTRFLAGSATFAAMIALTLLPASAFALSQLPSAEEAPAVETTAPEAPVTPPSQEGTAAEEEVLPPEKSDTLIEKVAPLVDSLTGKDNGDISHDLTALPEPVARMRQLILDAAAKGDLKAVAALMNPGPDQTSIGADDSGNDLATALKDMSGDSRGMEILAIMMDVLSTGYARVGQGEEETYVWPYFVRANIAELTPAEEVELMRIVTAGDYANMLEFGGYNFYRIGISPDGRWRFFLAGD